MGSRMRKALLTVMVLSLGLVGMAPASAADRVVNTRYEHPAAGSSDSGGGCLNADPEGCEQVPSGPGENFMSVELIDDSGAVASASVSWDTDGDGISDTGFEVCGKTASPQEVPSSTAVNVFVWASPSSTCPDAMATAGTIKATFSATAAVEGDTSALGSPKAGLGFSDNTPKRGATLTAKARLKICGDHAGTQIELHRKKGGVFKKIAAKKLSADCRASFKVVADFKSATFRTVWPKQDKDHRAGKSKPVTITTH